MARDDGGEAFAWLALFVLVLGVLLVVGVWWVIAAVVAAGAAAAAKEAKRQYLKKRAGEEFDNTMTQEGLTLPVDNSMDALFVGGLDLNENGGLDPIDVLVYAAGGDEVEK